MSWISWSAGPSPNFQRKKPFRAYSNKPVRKSLNNPIDCPSPPVNKGFNELYRCSPEKQQSSQWEKAVRQPAESKLLLKLQFHDGSFIFRKAFQPWSFLCCLPWFPSPWSTKSLAAALLIKSSLWTRWQSDTLSLKVSFSSQIVYYHSLLCLLILRYCRQRILSVLEHQKSPVCFAWLQILVHTGCTGDGKTMAQSFQSIQRQLLCNVALWPFRQTLMYTACQFISGYSCGLKHTWWMAFLLWYRWFF